MGLQLIPRLKQLRLRIDKLACNLLTGGMSRLRLKLRLSQSHLLYSNKRAQSSFALRVMCILHYSCFGKVAVSCNDFVGDARCHAEILQLG